jgi:hypothetical protein
MKVRQTGITSSDLILLPLFRFPSLPFPLFLSRPIPSSLVCFKVRLAFALLFCVRVLAFHATVCGKLQSFLLVVVR